MPFVKLDCKILDKSIWDEDSDTRIAWITLLTMADSDGLVEASITGIAARARISIENADKAIKKFMEPDLLSTNNTNDGRRIERNNRGFQILNYQQYRDKDYTSAARQRKHRELSRVTGVTSPHTYISSSESVLSYLNLKTNKRYRNNKEILARLKDGYTEDQLNGIIDAKICDPYFIENGQYLNPITLFRKSHIDNYINQKPDEFSRKKSFGGYTETVAHRQESTVDPVAAFLEHFPQDLLIIKVLFKTPAFNDALLALFKDNEELNARISNYKKTYPDVDERLYRKNYLYGKYGIPEGENE